MAVLHVQCTLPTRLLQTAPDNDSHSIWRSFALLVLACSGSTSKTEHVRSFGDRRHLDCHCSRNVGHSGNFCAQEISHVLFHWLPAWHYHCHGESKPDPLCDLHDLQLGQSHNKPHLCQCGLYSLFDYDLLCSPAISVQKGRSCISSGSQARAGVSCRWIRRTTVKRMARVQDELASSSGQTIIKLASKRAAKPLQ